MAVTLIKTIGGSGGAPEKCERCGKNHFIRHLGGWCCAACGLYVPPQLPAPKDALVSLRENFARLQGLHGELKGMIRELEELVD